MESKLKIFLVCIKYIVSDVMVENLKLKWNERM